MNYIAVYGVRGSFSEAASLKFASGLCDGFELVYLTEFTQIADAFRAGRVTHAVVPTENSTVGAVLGAADFLSEIGATIIADFWQPIIHSLMAKPGSKIDDIREITSHEQALNQCRGTISKICPDAILTPYDDTATAAEFVAMGSRNDLAAIAHGSCAEIYGLCILKSPINDNPQNQTHFVVVKTH